MSRFLQEMFLNDKRSKYAARHHLKPAIDCLKPTVDGL